MQEITKKYYLLDLADKLNILNQCKNKGLSLRSFVKTLGISATYLCDVLAGKQNLTVELKEKMEKQGIIF